MSHLEQYPHPFVTVDVLLFAIINNKLSVCLTLRDSEPFKDVWALPGTYIHEDESAEGAIDRLLVQKLGFSAEIYLEQLHTFTELHRDPRDRVISIAYLGITAHPELIDKPWITWYEIQNTSQKCRLISEDKTFLSSNLAFDHSDILLLGLDRLVGKLGYTDIVFRFLPDAEFTARQLREIYQAITEQEINRGNFTKYIMNTYEQRGLITKCGTRSEGPGRPADTYRYNNPKGGSLWIKS